MSALTALSLLAKSFTRLVEELGRAIPADSPPRSITLGETLKALESDGLLPEAILGDCIALLQTRNLWAHSMGGLDLLVIDLSNDLRRLIGVAQWFLTESLGGPHLSPVNADQMIQKAIPQAGVQPRRVFLCYAQEDEATVKQLHSALRQRGHKPWMDKEDILPGQKWEQEVRNAIRRSDFFLACMSSSSVLKRSYLQKELRLALEVLEEIPPGRIFIIPIRLDLCDVPDSLRALQWLDLFKPGQMVKLFRAIEGDMQ